MRSQLPTYRGVTIYVQPGNLRIVVQYSDSHTFNHYNNICKENDDNENYMPITHQHVLSHTSVYEDIMWTLYTVQCVHGNQVSHWVPQLHQDE